jgi:hypothetical protein
MRWDEERERKLAEIVKKKCQRGVRCQSHRARGGLDKYTID